MTPLLLCAYKPRYLRVVLQYFRDQGVLDRFRIFAWDNGGAAEMLREAGLEWQCVRDDTTGEPVNIGKALAMKMLVEAVNEQMPQADVYVCMDDDVIVGLAQLEMLAAVARRPGMGMIGARFHPFNSTAGGGGSVVSIDPGLRMRVHPVEDRTVHKLGKVAGTLFAVSRAAVAQLPWGPHLYPILVKDGSPIVYWGEDAELDIALTKAGLLNGHLENADLVPAIHLPDLDPDYLKWKRDTLVKLANPDSHGEL